MDMTVLEKKGRTAAGLAIAVIVPWLVGIVSGEAGHGIVASFGAYLLAVSFPVLPERGRLKLLLLSSLIISGFAALGASVSFGSVLFFAGALVAALAQCLSELKGGHYRLPVALGALAYFLSVGQVPSGGVPLYGAGFLAGTLWASLFVSVLIPVSGKAMATGLIDLVKSVSQQRFAAVMGITALAGSAIALVSPGLHPCWLPAAGLRVMKPTRQQTIYRMKARGLGATLGAATGGAILGLSSIPYLHALLVGALVFTMLMIGAKKYGPWSFCLTAVALAFNLSPDGSIVEIAFNRVLLTVGGIALAMLMLPLLASDAARDRKPA